MKLAREFLQNWQTLYGEKHQFLLFRCMLDNNNNNKEKLQGFLEKKKGYLVLEIKKKRVF